MRSFWALVLGFILKLFLEGFSRIIIAFFNTIDYTFFGINSLPSNFWVIMVYLISIISTWFGSMMMLTIGDKSTGKLLFFFALMIAVWHLFEILSSWYFVPKWYLFTFPLTSFIGILISKKTFDLNNASMAE